VRCLAALGDAALDVLPLNVVGVVGLDISGETVQSALDGFLGGRVHHAGLEPVSSTTTPPSTSLPDRRESQTYVLRRIIRCPADKRNLATRALAAVVLDVEDGIATTNALLALAVFALGIEQLLAEDVEVGFLGCFLDNNLFPVVADLVDNPLDVLAKLQLVEGVDALGRYGDPAGR
jgi:hypothetical protein